MSGTPVSPPGTGGGADLHASNPGPRPPSLAIAASRPLPRAPDSLPPGPLHQHPPPPPHRKTSRGKPAPEAAAGRPRVSRLPSTLWAPGEPGSQLRPPSGGAYSPLVKGSIICGPLCPGPRLLRAGARELPPPRAPSGPAY